MSDAIYELRIWLPPVKEGEPRDARWEIERLDSGETRRGVHLDPEHPGPAGRTRPPAHPLWRDPPNASARFAVGNGLVGLASIGLGDIKITVEEMGLTVASVDDSGTTTITKVPLGED